MADNSENNIYIGLPLSYNIDSHLQVYAAVNATYTSFLSQTNNIFQVAPGIRFRKNIFSGHAGIYPTWGSGGKMYFLPDVAVNFTLPEEPEDYVHRIGRTGRAGKTGTSISFACEDDAFRLEPLQALLGKEIKYEQPPAQLLLPTPDLPPAPRRPRPDGPRTRSRSSGNRSRSPRA